MISFLESLRKSPQEKLQEELLFAVQEVKSHWEVSISKTKASIARAERNLADAYAKADLQSIVDCTNEVRSLKEGLAIALEAFPILFPAE